MPYTLYGDLRSGAFSSEAALAEAQADYRFERISLDAEAQKSPEFLAINPTGKVPALQCPEGTLVTESMAILLTIADRHPKAQLLPEAGSSGRAEALRWLAFMAGEIYPMVEISDFPERFVPVGAEAEALRAKAKARIRTNLLVLEGAVRGPWLLGDGFTLVDIYLAMFTRWKGSVGQEWLAAGPIPSLVAITDRLSLRPRTAPVWRRHFG